MSTNQELLEIQRYLKILGNRWKIAHENWVKEIIKSVLNRRFEILSNAN